MSALLLVTFGFVAASASPASAVNCGVGGCGRYYITVTYAGGTVVETDYASQWQWMQDATGADVRGWRGTSGYATMKVGDVTNSFEVQANYCSNGGGGCFSDISNGLSGQPGWKYKYGSCNAGYSTAVEALAWVYYLDALRHVDAGDASLAVLWAPSTNTASYSKC